MHKIKFTSL